jgi:4-hydroxybenzoate polyprenyltransferase
VSAARALVGAAHPGPALAVTGLAALLAVRAGTGPATGVLVVAAVLAGQLSIGWSNDLVDAARDRTVGRTDKPLATGAVGAATTRAACAVAVLLTVVLSLACGLLAGLVHLVCVAAGWAYNLGAKSTAWSWLPYAVAFGLLPVFVDLAAASAAAAGPTGSAAPIAGPATPPGVVAGGALLGVGAHLVNVLPDLADDAATGVRGLPHRLGATRTRLLAVAALVLATVVLLLFAPDLAPVPAGAAAVLVAALAGLALVGRGAAPFRAAVGIAVVDVVVLVWAR